MKKLNFISLILTLTLSAQAAPVPGELVTSGPRDQNKIALTFDDGPGKYTEQFIEMFDRHNVKVTFFMQGDQVKIRPQIAKIIAEKGHEVASHTWNHTNYKKKLKTAIKNHGDEDKALGLVKEELRQDFRHTHKLIKDVTDVDPVIVRMPHGIDRPWIKDIAREENIVLVNWTYGADWTKTELDKLIASYKKAVKPGAILLFHDGGARRDRSLKMAEAVILHAKENNYDIVPVGELIGVKKENQ